MKWLRYYLDFCEKYQFPHAERISLDEFLEKLREKKQTPAQQEQATLAISFFFELISQKINQEAKADLAMAKTATYGEKSKNESASFPESRDPPRNDTSSMAFSGDTPSCGTKSEKKSTMKKEEIFPLSSLAGKENPSVPVVLVPKYKSESSNPEKGTSWESQYSKLGSEIQVRHYSPKTAKVYKFWIRKFQTFTQSKAPELLSIGDVKEFLTFLAVKEQVAASTQNQAFNALLFFFRHVLDKEFGKVDGVIRAKQKPHIPVVLSREEIEAILPHLSTPYDLVVKLLYGCGLRLFECLQLRVQCFNFDAGNLTVRDGKGKKDRTVPLP
ncbi:MAG: phage integrase N-terminal SAM-like domain-containing protein, partial [Candidatus Ozemobacteraceae bacterium]